MAARPIVVSRPTWKNTSLAMPRISVANTAPNTPSGTTSNTTTGIDQLSYNAAKHKNTTANEMAYSAGPLLPASRSSKDTPVHSTPMPGGSLATKLCIRFIASPVLSPGAAAP